MNFPAHFPCTNLGSMCCLPWSSNREANERANEADKNHFDDISNEELTTKIYKELTHLSK